MNKLSQVLLTLCLVAVSDLCFAACLPDVNAASSCRFEQGDAWCVEHGNGNRFAFHDDCLKDASPSSTPSEATLPDDKRWIIIASRPTIEEAEAIAVSYKSDFQNVAVFSSKNGNYAVTIGDEAYPNAQHVLAEFIAAKKIPDDSFLATGRNLYKISVSKAKKTLPILFDGEGQPFLMSTPNGIKEPKLSVKAKKNKSTQRNIDAKLISIGQTVHVYSEGRFIDSAVISGIHIHQGEPCDDYYDYIQWSNSEHLTEGQESIIVSTVPLPRHPASPRVLTEAEKTAANQLVDRFLSQKGFASWLSTELQKNLSIKPINFRDNNGNALVISGHYEWNKGKDESIEVFFLAQPTESGKWELTYDWYNQIYLGNATSINFINYADIDGDGIDELIYIRNPKDKDLHYYFNEYVVLKKDPYGNSWGEETTVSRGCPD